MKKINMYFNRVFIILIGCLFIFSTPTLAKEYTYKYEFTEPVIETLPTGLQIVTIENTCQRESTQGAPVLPVRTAKLYIPGDEKVTSITISHDTSVQIEGFYKIQYGTTPYPLSYTGPIIADAENRDIYNRDSFYPSANYIDKGIQYLHGTKILIVDLFPVIFNPMKGQIKYYRTIKLIIETSEQKGSNTNITFRNFDTDKESILSFIDNDSYFLNNIYDLEISKLNSTSSKLTDNERQYLIITTSDLEDYFQQLTTYRQSTAGGGFNTYIETVEYIDQNFSGRDLAEKIRNYIIYCYANHGTQFVVLGGDADGVQENQVIPTRGTYAVVGSTTETYIPSDLYYGCLDGNWNYDGDALWGEANDGIDGGDIDWISEVYVGRIPADTATEVFNFITKIISYETGNNPHKTLLVGEQLDSTPTWGGDRMDWVYGYMNYMPNSQIYDRDWSGNNWSSAELISLINTNEYDWINHLGHANTWYAMKMYYTEVASLGNNVYSFIYTQGCYPGAFDNRNSSGSYSDTDSFSEAITVGYSDRGASAIIANSRYGWYNFGSYVSGASNLAHKEFVEAVFTDNYTRIGMANQISKTDLDLSSGIYRWIAFETNLLGDPATKLNVSCDDSVLQILSVTPSNQFVAGVGNELTIEAKLVTGCGDLVTGANVTAAFSNGDQGFLLYDDGTHSDSTASDGVYSNSWTPVHGQDPTSITLNASKSGYSDTTTTITGRVFDIVTYHVDDTVDFSWIDISSSGNVLIADGDDVGATINLDFTFNFYGADYSSIWVTSNGFATFNSSNSTYSNTDIPDFTEPNALVAPFWDDLSVADGVGQILYQTFGSSPNRKLVITWENIDHFDYYNNPISFQIVLSEKDGSIKFQYLDVSFNYSAYDCGLSATVGLENGDGSYGDKYSYNSASLENNKAILFSPLSTGKSINPGILKLLLLDED